MNERIGRPRQKGDRNGSCVTCIILKYHRILKILLLKSLQLVFNLRMSQVCAFGVRGGVFGSFLP